MHSAKATKGSAVNPQKPGNAHTRPTKVIAWPSVSMSVSLVEALSTTFNGNIKLTRIILSHYHFLFEPHVSMNPQWAEFLRAQTQTPLVAPSSYRLHDVLPELGIIRLRGDDAIAFAQAQFSCDAQNLDARRWTWGAYCSAKGRVLANFILWRHQAELRMLLPRTQIQSITKRLRMFVLRSRVDVVDDGDGLVFLGISEDRDRCALRLVGLTPGDEGANLLPYGKDGQALMLSAQRTLIVATCEDAQRAWQALRDGATIGDAAHWNRLWIEQGEPWITFTQQDAFVPQMLNLELLGAVSFTKGCYPGQEVVARSQHLGQVKRRLYRYGGPTTEQVQPGSPLFMDSEGAGTVVNVETVEGSNVALLAVVQTTHSGKSLSVESAQGPSMHPLPLPYEVPR